MVICLISDASSSNIRPPRYVFPTDERDDNVYNRGGGEGEQMAEIPLLDNFYICEFNFLI